MATSARSVSPGGPVPAPARKPADSCPTHVWVGLPYLNRFYDESLQNGACTPGPTYIGSNTIGTLSGSAGATYIQEADVTITGTFTLAAGSVLQEIGGGHLYIDGAFNASGTATQPIFIIGTLPGAWQGIVFGVGSTGALAYVTVGEATTGLSVGNASPTIDHSTIELSTGDGIRITDDGSDAPPAPTLTNDTFIGNSGDAVHVVNTVPQAAWTVSGLSASGNGFDGIVVDGGTVLSGHTWSMAQGPGVPLAIGNGGRIEVRGGAGLSLTGSASAPFTIMAVGGPYAYWQNILFDGGSSGALSYVHLSNGGNYANVYATVEIDDSSPSLTNVTIDHSGTDAVRITGYNNPNINPTLANDTFTNSAGVAVELGSYVPQVSWAWSGLQAGGNGCDCIQIDGGTVTKGDTWTIPQDPGLPLEMINGITIQNGGTLTIQGLTHPLELAGSTSVNVQGGGTLNMTGSAATPILVTGIGQIPSCWGQVYLQGSGSLSYVHLSHGGCGSNVYATVYIDNSSPSLTNVTIDHSATDAVYINGGNNASINPTLANDTFTNSAATAVELAYYLPQVTWALSGLQASGNGCDCVQIDGGTVTAGNTWRIPQDPGLSLAFPNGITIQGGATLIVQGLTHPLEIGANTSVNVQGGGTLTMTGSASNPIAVTAIGAPFACWGEIDIQGSASLSYVHLSYGGCGTNVNATAEIDNSSPSLTNVTVDHSASDAVRIDGGINPTINPTLANDTFTNSAGAATNGAGAAVELVGYVPQVTWNVSGLQANGNVCDCVQVDGGHVTQGDTWTIPSDPGIPVVFNGDVTVDNGGKLDIEGLRQLRIASPPGFGANINVNGGGTLVMAGTAAAPIAVTATGAPAACWGEVNFNPGSSGNLNYVHLSYGGCARYGPYLAVYVDDSNPTITNVTIDHGAAGGLELRGYDDPGMNPVIANDTFTANAGPAIYIQNVVPQVAWKLSNLRASGDGCDCIQLDGGTVYQGDSWTIPQDPGLPIDLGYLTVQSGATLAIQGLTHPLLLTGGSWQSGINVQGGGTLAISGTAILPIAITAPAQSCWRQINFNPGSSGSLSYVHLSYGGCVYPNGAEATIEVDSNVGITNATIDHGFQDDIDIANGALPTLTQDNFGAVPSGDYGVLYRGWGTGQPQAAATCNWWGATSGPSGAGSGAGMPVSAGVTYAPWLTVAAPTAAGNCNGRSSHVNRKPIRHPGSGSIDPGAAALMVRSARVRSSG